MVCVAETVGSLSNRLVERMVCVCADKDRLKSSVDSSMKVLILIAVMYIISVRCM